MTNPFQHSASSFGGDPASSTGFPAPLGQHRSSYASVVSSGGALSRSSRLGAFHNILNPASDLEAHGLYPGQRHPRLDGGMTHDRGGTPGEDGLSSSGWPPRLRAALPWFSSAFDQYVNKEPLFPAAGAAEDSFTGSISPPFLSPSYLRGTVYLSRLEEAHKAKVLAEREVQAAKTQSNGALASSGNSHAPTSKLPSGSHKGVQFEVVEKTPAVEDDAGISPLPSRWNKDDKDHSLEVLGDGFEVKHTGRSSAEHEACAIRADHHMPALCGIYYFEVIILNRKRDDTTIGIGFSSKSVSLQRAPGWEPESWGYHGDDGHSFAAQNVGKPYGPKFGPGDTVGCLVNFRLGHALFTKNGEDLGIAFRDSNFKDIKGRLYPTVGLKKPGDHVLINLGQLPFKFDIDGYMKNQRRLIQEDIEAADTSKLAPPLNETELIQQLVLQFLQHDGYVETARAFAEEIHDERLALSLDQTNDIPGINIKDDEDAHNRQRIRRAILDGDIDKALKYTKSYYPAVLKDNEEVYFRLRCRKFIEMIRKEGELNLRIESKTAQRGRPLLREADLTNNRNLEDDEIMTEADGVWDEQMDTEDGISPTTATKLSSEALDYGMELWSEFRNDPRPDIVKHLDEIFALIAHPNPLKLKEMAHLFDASGRVAVSEELNSAILHSLGKSSRAALETLCAQTEVLLDDLRKDGGDGPFVSMDDVLSLLREDGPTGPLEYP
ncbi:hypothetical protein QBC47DRAFT_406951 [Echria macrotheca]|uniref:Protein SSH4 n=1 Tax=Echria macrotheca TaxID=438768 RepID=A0AAJ0B757_9PEZI|nr:hypothetical protein QBC47DRAFT_406951 [Echria macrotheca]